MNVRCPIDPTHEATQVWLSKDGKNAGVQCSHSHFHLRAKGARVTKSDYLTKTNIVFLIGAREVKDFE